MKMLLYSATKSLDMRYVFKGAKEDAEIKISGAEPHAVLHTAYTDLISIRKKLYSTEVKATTNFATAKMTILFTDTDTDEGYLGEEIMVNSCDVHVKHQPNRILSSLNLYDGVHDYDEKKVYVTKKSRNSAFNTCIEQNVVNFSKISRHYDFSKTTVKTAAEFKDAISNQMFHENFHHTEQGLMYYLCGPGLSNIVALASQSQAAYIYGIILDLYTSRMMCCNCNACLLGMQHSQEQGFLAQLKHLFAEEKIQTRKNLMLSIRVSASQAPKGANLEVLRLPEDKGIVHEYNPDQATKIFQAENRALGTKKIANGKQLSLAHYRGTIFVSTTFKKENLEKHIRLQL